jgi:hypothetical protein
VPLAKLLCCQDVAELLLRISKPVALITTRAKCHNDSISSSSPKPGAVFEEASIGNFSVLGPMAQVQFVLVILTLALMVCLAALLHSMKHVWPDTPSHAHAS